MARMEEIKELRCFRGLRNTPKFEKALGTLGGGNHFQEIDEGGGVGLRLRRTYGFEKPR